MNADYSESLKHVNSSEYEEVFENLNDFVSDNVFSPHLFNAMLGVMQREDTHSL